jgi:chemotaxis protein methyltransferase CheR
MILGLTKVDFDYVRFLVHEQSAIVLGPGKEYLVEARLTPLAQREGLDSVGDLLTRLRTPGATLKEAVVEAMTTNETSFFRDVHPFDALRDEIIPSLLAAGGPSLRLWSAAASTGQEAYSLALMVREHFPQVTDVTILATDLSREVLRRAEEGVFSQMEVNRGLPAALLAKYFERHGRQWQVKDSIRSMVTFRQLNLAKPLPALPSMDVAFLRNVLIYFDKADKTAVLSQTAKTLRSGGYLFLGGAETTHGIDERFETLKIGRSVCYRYTG